MPDSSDADLVRRAQGGDVNAIGELYDRHHVRIFRYVWSHLRDEQAAEDLTGEVFARMVRSIPQYRAVGVPFQAWLYRIAHNLMVDRHRKEGQVDLVPLDRAEGLIGAGGDPSAIVERRLGAEQIWRALDRLDPLQREVVVLRFLSGLPLQEVALSLRKSVAAVKSLQRRGLAALQAAVQDG